MLNDRLLILQPRCIVGKSLNFVLTNQKTALKGRLLKGKRSLIGHVSSTQNCGII